MAAAMAGQGGEHSRSASVALAAAEAATDSNGPKPVFSPDMQGETLYVDGAASIVFRGRMYHPVKWVSATCRPGPGERLTLTTVNGQVGDDVVCNDGKYRLLNPPQPSQKVRDTVCPQLFALN